MALLNAVTSIEAPKQEQSNFHHFVVEIAWFGLALPATTRFLQIYAIRLGADASHLALLASLQALVLLLTASLGERWMRRHTDSSKATFWPSVGFRLSFLLPALTPFMPPSFQLMWLILSIVLPSLAQGIASVAFLVMFREGISQKNIEPLLSKRLLAVNITVAISGLGMGFWLEKATFPFNYQIMFVFAFIMAMISFWHVSRVRVQPELVVKVPKTVIVKPWRTPAFQVVAFVIFLTFISFNVNQPFISLHLTKNLHATEGFISLVTIAELLAGALITLRTRQIIERLGNRGMMAVMMLGTALSSFMIAMAQNLPVTLLASAIGGAAWTAVNIGLFAFFTEMTPAEHKTAYTIAYNQAVFIAMFLGPIIGLIGKSLAPGGASLVILLVFGSVLRLLAGILTQSHPRAWMSRALHLNLSPR